ncbi:MAG TPA: glycerol kinase GlpK [Ktedonobacteraceae bacterium]|nr:glycerol kinase GlpK [Ktedonobacteraceae bacterium]
MKTQSAILAIDQGTTRTKALIFDAQAHCLAKASSEIPLTYPCPGWVEQDPRVLLNSVLENVRAALNATRARIVACGLANQGETVMIWRKSDGQPLYPAISWQDRRTAAFCARLAESDEGRFISEHTGLPLDPYFSATKLRWLLDNVPEARALAARGNLLAGTTDSWLLWNLTGQHLTDDATASRTMLYNPRLRAWDQDVLEMLNIPRSILPAIRPTCSSFGTIRADLSGQVIPVSAAIVDQQGALFGQVCFAPGDVKVTYGTGAFILLNTGRTLPASQHGLVPTVAWTLDNETSYALDGGIYVAGAAVQWLRDGLGIISHVEESQALAESVPDNGGVFFVPALTGLAAPYWDSSARGALLGLTRGTTRAHIVRATLEGVAFRTRDILEAMTRDTGRSIRGIKVDGGASANHFLMRVLADISGVEVRVSAIQETTSLGVAFLAGLGSGLWRSQAELSALWHASAVYAPRPSSGYADLYPRWLEAIERSRGWAKDV